MEYPTSEQIEKIIEELKEAFEKQLKNKEEFNRQRYNTNIQINPHKKNLFLFFCQVVFYCRVIFCYMDIPHFHYLLISY